MPTTRGTNAVKATPSRPDCQAREYLTGEPRREVMNFIRDIARDEAPVTIRHLFYRAATQFSDRIPKTPSGARKINRMVNEMRWTGEIEWDWLRDSSRHPVFAGGFRDSAHMLRIQARAYRVNAWFSLPDSVSVWCESESALGMIDQMVTARGVDIYPCRGEPSNDFIKRAIDFISGDTRNDGTAYLYYVGDWDHEGRQIPEVLQRKLEKDFAVHVDFEFRFKRLAINEDQIARHNLPQKPGKYADLTVELEAMPAPLLRKIIAEAIDQHMPAHMLATLRQTESEERAGMSQIAEAAERGLSLKRIGDIVSRASASN